MIKIADTKNWGIFMTERAGTPYLKLFLRRTQAGTFSFPGVGITSTPLSYRILGSSLRSETYIFRKIALPRMQDKQ
jgi:hypothetical protein